MAIHIKKSHRGRFNAYKKRTGKTTAEALHSKNPHVRAMANFARNAKKWKHELGGYLDMLENGSYLPEFQFGGQEPLFGSTTKIKTPSLTSTANILETNNPGIFDSPLQPSNNPYTPPSTPPSLDASGVVSSIGGNAGLVASIVEMVGGAASDYVSGVYEDKMNKTANSSIKGLREMTPDQIDQYALQGTVPGAMDYWEAGGIGALIGGITSGGKARDQANELNRDIRKQTNTIKTARRTTNAGQANPYQPVGFASQGGFIAYKGETHKDGIHGGNLVDEQGNPTGQTSIKPPIALTEKKEVSRYDPNTHSTYIYSNSDRLEFAKPATSLLNKYKLDKPESMQYQQYKHDTLTKAAVDKQFDNLTTAQEFAKETSTSFKDTMNVLPTAGKGGYLSVAKAKEMLRDGTAHGKKLTARQKRYFGWVAGGKKEDGGLLGDPPNKNNTKLSAANNYYMWKTDADMDALIRDMRAVPDSIQTITPQMRVEAALQNPDRFKVGRKAKAPYGTANAEGWKYAEIVETPTVNPLTPRNTNYMLKENEFATAYEPFVKKGGGGYVRKRKHPATYPFAPIPHAPSGAYAHSAAGPMTLADYSMGGELPMYQNGGPDNPLGLPEDFGTVGGMYNRRPNSGLGYYNHLYGDRQYNFGTGYQLPQSNFSPSLTYPEEKVPVATQPVANNTPSWKFTVPQYSIPEIENKYRPTTTTATTEQVQEESWNPQLNPLGHLASIGAGFLDYNRLKKAAPTPVKLQTATAERISLAKQRLANIRNAEASRSLNSYNARNLGVNAGSAYSNIAAANTGVNRLLGQENAKLLETEENTNAQLKTQVNMLNAELKAQEALFNTQQSNAYKMLMAENDPWSNALKSTASYFKDNASYKRDYDTMQMLAPNAELYKDPNATKWQKTTGQNKKVRFNGKEYSVEELKKLLNSTEPTKSKRI